MAKKEIERKKPNQKNTNKGKVIPELPSKKKSPMSSSEILLDEERRNNSKLKVSTNISFFPDNYHDLLLIVILISA